MKTNYVLIDYENVQPDSVAELNKEQFKLMVFVGAGQVKVTFNVADEMQALGERAEYIKINGDGRNNLDFHIACYVGKLTALDPESYVHVISKDRGYDRLIEYLKSKGLHVARWAEVNEIPILKATNTLSVDDKQSIIIAYLVKRGSQRPKSVKTLTGTVSALFQPRLEDAEVTMLLKQLDDLGVYWVEGSKVEYSLPD